MKCHVFYTVFKQNFKKILLILFTTMWIAHPSFAATTHHHTTTKKHPLHKSHKSSHTSKKHNRVKTKKKSAKKSHQRTVKKPGTKHVTPVVKSISTHTTAINTSNVTKTHLPGYLLSSIEKTVVDAVRTTITTLRYTAYKLGGTRIDSSRGIYIVDCSTYVDYILKTIYPHAYTSLTSWSGSDKPTSNDYYHYFTNLSDDTRSNWNTIEDVEKLRPGDVLVFRYKNKMGNERGGHVMIVMDKPIQTRDAFLVRVADSAPTGHSTDTRLPHASGIGIGSLLLKVDPKTYRPYAYAWKIGSRWEKNVNFAMARPIPT